MKKKEDHTEDCGPNGCSAYCQSEQYNDGHVTMVEYTPEQQAIVEALYNELLASIEKTRKDGVIDVPMVVMPFAAVLSGMFALVEAQGGEKTDYLIIAFAKLLRHNVESHKSVISQEMGNA